MALELRRGDLITVAISGDYGKPRPALVIQSNSFLPHESIVVALITSQIRDFVPIVRITVDPSPANGLRVRSQVTLDKLLTIPTAKAGKVIGRMDQATMAEVNQGLFAFLNID